MTYVESIAAHGAPFIGLEATRILPSGAPVDFGRSRTAERDDADPELRLLPGLAGDPTTQRPRSFPRICPSAGGGRPVTEATCETCLSCFSLGSRCGGRALPGEGGEGSAHWKSCSNVPREPRHGVRLLSQTRDVNRAFCHQTLEVRSER